MKINKIISRLATGSSDPVELRRVARALGNELPNKRTNVLREFRSRLACVPIGPDVSVDTDEVSFATGYVAGLSDVSAEYEVAIESGDVLSEEVASGIQLAVELFQHMVTSAFTSDSSLREIAARILGDVEAADEAVELWRTRSYTSGLIGNVAADTTPAVHGNTNDIASVPTLKVPPVLAPRALLWNDHERATFSRPHSSRASTETLYEDEAESSATIPVPIRG